MGEIKNTRGASAEADRALAEGDAALASSSLRDGDPSRICPNPTLYDSGSCCGTCPDIEPQNDPSRNPQDEINFDSFGRPARRKLATAVRYFMAQLRQSYFGEEHGAPAVMDGPTAAMPRGCWFDDESGRLLKALKPAQAIEARQGGDAEGGSVEDKSAVAAGDVPASKSEDHPPSSTPGEVERLVDALIAVAQDGAWTNHDGAASWGRDEYDTVYAKIVAARTALLSHISTAGRGEGAVPAAIHKIDPQVWTAASELNAPQKRQPEWLWFDYGVEPTNSFGRWGKTSQEAPYIRADIVLEIISAADATNPQDQE